jgi:hypothetical protein
MMTVVEREPLLPGLRTASASWTSRTSHAPREVAHSYIIDRERGPLVEGNVSVAAAREEYRVVLIESSRDGEFELDVARGEAARVAARAARHATCND